MIKGVLSLILVSLSVSSVAHGITFNCRLAKPAKDHRLYISVTGDSLDLFTAREAQGRAKIRYVKGKNQFDFNIEVGSYYSKPFTVNIFSRPNRQLGNFAFFLRSNRVTDEDQSTLVAGLFGENHVIRCGGITRR